MGAEEEKACGSATAAVTEGEVVEPMALLDEYWFFHNALERRRRPPPRILPPTLPPSEAKEDVGSHHEDSITRRPSGIDGKPARKLLRAPSMPSYRTRQEESSDTACPRRKVADGGNALVRAPSPPAYCDDRDEATPRDGRDRSRTPRSSKPRHCSSSCDDQRRPQPASGIPTVKRLEGGSQQSQVFRQPNTPLQRSELHEIYPREDVEKLQRPGVLRGPRIQGPGLRLRQGSIQRGPRGRDSRPARRPELRRRPWPRPSAVSLGSMVGGEISTAEAGVGGEEVCCRHEGAAPVLGEGSGLQRQAGVLTGDLTDPPMHGEAVRFMVSATNICFGIRDCTREGASSTSAARKEEPAAVREPRPEDPPVPLPPVGLIPPEHLRIELGRVKGEDDPAGGETRDVGSEDGLQAHRQQAQEGGRPPSQVPPSDR
ncbi:hypothetical protein B296_00030806 [Ensete ventricosum]|uniref:Uncharacterized protein n=1 Tax=Ensete ventricosum TaxID=4639 RepID=A0A426X8G9_ENSVE|nr:hypothetical protein B296_00030806 [Ensete ventricosum]